MVDIEMIKLRSEALDIHNMKLATWGTKDQLVELVAVLRKWTERSVFL